MKTLLYLVLLFFLPFLFTGCSKKNEDSGSLGYGSIEVILNDTPFKTNKYLRIPYSLRTWEWKKSGLSLRRIDVLDDVKQTVLVSYDSSQFPRIFHDPLPANPLMPFDNIFNYYFSIQVPVPLDQERPERVSNRLIFKDTLQNKDVTIEGGVFVPKYNETPLVISSPVKGTKWMWFNQSTNDYHFYTMVFFGGKIGTGERFAFDAMQMDDNYDLWCAGDPGQNSSYFCFRDTLYAVADGVVTACRDTMIENDGNLHNHLDFLVPIDYAGNYLILNIGNNLFAMYAHCSRYSIMVQAGDSVKEGEPVALLGNAGNSDAPHLHFEIGDFPDFFMANGIPFVLKKYTKIGEYQDPTPITPIPYYNIMMEERTVVSFD